MKTELLGDFISEALEVAGHPVEFNKMGAVAEHLNGAIDMLHESETNKHIQTNSQEPPKDQTKEIERLNRIINDLENTVCSYAKLDYCSADGRGNISGQRGQCKIEVFA